MTEQHPLTNEICDSIAPLPINRLPYEYDCMRTAADWQLEQVIYWAFDNLPTEQVNDLQLAMRPNDAAPWLDITYDAFNLTSDPK